MDAAVISSNKMSSSDAYDMWLNGVSVRLRSALARLNCRNLADAANVTSMQLYQLRNVGATTVQEFSSKMKQIGITVSSRVPKNPRVGDMTMRDHFAGLCIQGMIASGRNWPDMPAAAYEMADAMLAAR